MPVDLPEGLLNDALYFPYLTVYFYTVIHDASSIQAQTQHRVLCAFQGEDGQVETVASCFIQDGFRLTRPLPPKARPSRAPDDVLHVVLRCATPYFRGNHWILRLFPRFQNDPGTIRTVFQPNPGIHLIPYGVLLPGAWSGFRILHYFVGAHHHPYYGACTEDYVPRNLDPGAGGPAGEDYPSGAVEIYFD